MFPPGVFPSFFIVHLKGSPSGWFEVVCNSLYFVFRCHERYCKCEFLFGNSDSFTETNKSWAYVKKFPVSCVLFHLFPFPLFIFFSNGLLFCPSPVVFFSSSVYSCASPQNGGSLGRPPRCHLPSTIFNVPPVIYKKISMSNQVHSLSPTCLMLKNHRFKKPFSLPTVNVHRTPHTHSQLLSASWRLSGSRQSVSSREDSSFLLCLSRWFSVWVPSRLAD